MPRAAAFFDLDKTLMAGSSGMPFARVAMRHGIVGALIHELRRRGGGLGCAAICSGGGQGDAIVLEVNGG